MPLLKVTVPYGKTVYRHIFTKKLTNSLFCAREAVRKFFVYFFYRIRIRIRIRFLTVFAGRSTLSGLRLPEFHLAVGPGTGFCDYFICWLVTRLRCSPDLIPEGDGVICTTEPLSSSVRPSASAAACSADGCSGGGWGSRRPFLPLPSAKQLGIKKQEGTMCR